MCAPKTMVRIGVVFVAAFALGWWFIPEFRSRMITLAPFAIVLICPLAMLFGMRGHGGHDGEGSGDHRGHGGCCGGGSPKPNDDARGGHPDDHRGHAR